MTIAYIEDQVQTVFLECLNFSKKFDLYQLNLPKFILYISIMAKSTFYPMRQNRYSSAFAS